VVCAAQRTAATPPIEGADPAPRWTLRRLVGWARERFGLVCCRETIRAVLHRRTLSWKKAKKLLGRANPEQRQAFVERLRDVLAGAQRDQHLLVYLDEAHIHQDADLGYGWAKRGERFLVASRSPGLSARVSFYGLSLDNEGQVRLWPFPRANGGHTVAVLRRLRAEWPDRKLLVLWDGAPYHRAQAVQEAATALTITLMPLPGYSPDLMPVEALWRWLREDVTYHHCHASADDLTPGLRTQVNGLGWHAPCGAPRTAPCTGRARSWSKIAQRSRVSATASHPQVTNRASPSQFC